MLPRLLVASLGCGSGHWVPPYSVWHHRGKSSIAQAVSQAADAYLLVASNEKPAYGPPMDKLHDTGVWPDRIAVSSTIIGMGVVMAACFSPAPLLGWMIFGGTGIAATGTTAALLLLRRSESPCRHWDDEPPVAVTAAPPPGAMELLLDFGAPPDAYWVRTLDDERAEAASVSR